VQDAALIRHCEETCANAWPGLRQVLAGDWVLRFGEGLTRRANSMSPLFPAAGGLEAVLAHAGALYRAAGQPLLVRLPSFLDPVNESLLERLAFSPEGDTLHLHGPVLPQAAADPAVCIESGFGPGWLERQAHLQAYDAARARAFRRIVQSIALPVACCSLRAEGGVKCQAFGVLDDRLLCVESVITDARSRNRGYGRRILKSLFAWAAARGAEAACLQVQADNAPARALYHRLGLERELYRYHYRRQPAGGPAPERSVP